jgi:uncharacterized protein (TIGR02266 family)
VSEPPARRDKRIAALRGLLVRCDSWNEFVQHYATDISQGGMFIVTDDPPELLSDIEVQMSLPEGHDVMLRAQVVHVIDKAQAERDGRPAGIGVQFLDLDPVRKAQIHQLVEFARWEGATGRPQASLASRMFEAAASLPPAKLVEALPSQPPATASARGSVRAMARTEPAPASVPAKPRPTRAAEARATTRATSLTPAPNRAVSLTPAAGTVPPTVGSAAPPAGSTEPAAASPTAPPTGATPTADPAATGSQPPAARTTGKPLDTEKLKMGMTHLAHRRFLEAINVFSELSSESPQDPQPVLWRALARARLKLKDGDEAGAAEHYAQVLAIDEHNREARKFVREHGQKKRLQSLPFGRYFLKK